MALTKREYTEFMEWPTPTTGPASFSCFLHMPNYNKQVHLGNQNNLTNLSAGAVILHTL
jgi:hypothetical protein